MQPSTDNKRLSACFGFVILTKNKSREAGYIIVFFEENEGARLETVWEARNVPKLGEGVLYHYM